MSRGGMEGNNALTHDEWMYRETVEYDISLPEIISTQPSLKALRIMKTYFKNKVNDQKLCDRLYMFAR